MKPFSGVATDSRLWSLTSYSDRAILLLLGTFKHEKSCEEKETKKQIC